jgi:hypothetical protein
VTSVLHELRDLAKVTRKSSAKTYTCQYYLGDQMKENEIGEACGTCGSEEECVQGFGEV